MLSLQSSNPALGVLSDEPRVPAFAGPAATISGVVSKTALAMSMAVIAGAGGAAVTSAYPQTVWAFLIGSLVATLVVYLAIYSNPARAVWGAPVYAIAEGALLGSMATMLDGVLKAATGTAAIGGLGLQALIITLCIGVSMLAVYKAGWIRPNRTFRSVMLVLTMGVALTYMVGFALSFFSIQIPFLSLSSALEGGRAAWIGIGINVFILILASLWLVIDFQQIEEGTSMGMPQHMEWYFAFALMVTLVWIYLEALKLAFRVAAANRR